MDKSEYFKLIDKCAETQETFTIPNSEPKHAIYLLKTLFKNANFAIRIFTGRLFEGVYGNEDLKEEARNFLRKDANNSVRIAYQEPLDITNCAFIQTILNDEHRKGSLKVWNANEKFNDLNNHFAVMDERAFRFETDHTNTKAIANFGDPENAKRLVDFFDKISENSSIVIEK
jgi:hypothetical protein